MQGGIRYRYHKAVVLARSRQEPGPSCSLPKTVTQPEHSHRLVWELCLAFAAPGHRPGAAEPPFCQALWTLSSFRLCPQPAAKARDRPASKEQAVHPQPSGFCEALPFSTPAHASEADQSRKAQLPGPPLPWGDPSPGTSSLPRDVLSPRTSALRVSPPGTHSRGERGGLGWRRRCWCPHRGDLRACFFTHREGGICSARQRGRREGRGRHCLCRGPCRAWGLGSDLPLPVGG